MSEECSGSCGSCSEECASRKPSREEMLEPVNRYSKVKRVIGVVSGKGGVGKSFITSYMTTLLKKKGYETAILDADITGPSIPKAFGIHGKVTGNEMGIFPAESRLGTKIMSINLLLDDEDTPVIWRGPVIAGSVKEFWTQVVWGNVDYMFVDMPPGTGDVPLTVFQSIPLDGIIIVTSPQDLVSMIVGKAVKMAQKMEVPILGLIENYSYVQCPNCDEKIPVFGESKLEAVAEKYHLQILGRLPLAQPIAKAIDEEKVEELEGNWLDSAADYIVETLPPVEDKRAYGPLQIAVPVADENQVNPHFGSSEKFLLYTVEQGTVTGKKEIVPEGKGHDELGNLMKELGVKVLVCGGIGASAMDVLMKNEIFVVPGQEGDADAAVAAYLNGEASVQTEYTCQGHAEGESCGCGCGCHQ